MYETFLAGLGISTYFTLKIRESINIMYEQFIYFSERDIQNCCSVRNVKLKSA